MDQKCVTVPGALTRLERSRPAACASPSSAARAAERARWDRVAGSFKDLYGAATTHYYRECEISLIRRHAGTLRGRRVLKLDLWNEAVNTRILHWVCAEGAAAWGMDHSEIVTHRARSNAPDLPLRLIQGDVRDLPFAPASFDFVYTMGTIEHIDEYEQAVREIRRVLRPGGRAIIGVPHRFDLFLRPMVVYVLDKLGQYPYSPERAFSAGELAGVIRSAGLHVLHRTGILLMPGVLRMADAYVFNRGGRVGGLVSPLLRPLLAMETSIPWTGRFGYMLSIVAELPR